MVGHRSGSRWNPGNDGIRWDQACHSEKTTEKFEAFSKYISENYGLDSIKTLLEGDKAQIEKSVTLLKQVQSHIGLTISMDPSDESAGSLEDLEWRTWKVYSRELNHFSFTYMIVLTIDFIT